MQFTFFYQKIILVDFSTKNYFFVASIQKFSLFFMPGKVIIWLLFVQKWLLLVNNNRMSYYSVIICPKWLLANNNPNNNIGRKKMWVIAQVLKRKDPKRARKYGIYVFLPKKHFGRFQYQKRLFCHFDSEILTFFHAGKSYYLVIIRPKMVIISS